VHLRPSTNSSGVELYMITGGYIDDVGGRLAAGAKRGGPNGGTQPPYGLTVSGPMATDIGVNAVLDNNGPHGAFLDRSKLGRVIISSSRDVAAAAEEGRAEPAGARGKPAAVIFCAADGSCQPTWRQPVFVPMGYRSSKAPKELHVYVSAADGTVVAKLDRLRTWGFGKKKKASRRFGYQTGLDEAGLMSNEAPGAPAAASDVPNLLPQSAYVTPRSDTPEARRAAEAINHALKERYDGPAMTPSQGVGETMYSGTVPLDTAQVTRLTRRGQKVSSGFILTDLKRLGQRTYDLKGKDDKARDGSVTGQVVTDRSNLWGNGRTNDRQTVAADAHFGMGVVYDYYQERHGRNGIDGHGTPIFGRTHLGKRLDDAYCECCWLWWAAAGLV